MGLAEMLPQNWHPGNNRNEGSGCGRGHLAAFNHQKHGGHNDCHGQQARMAARGA